MAWFLRRRGLSALLTVFMASMWLPPMPEVRQQRSFVVVRQAEIDSKSTRVSLHHTGLG